MDAGLAFGRSVDPEGDGNAANSPTERRLQHRPPELRRVCQLADLNGSGLVGMHETRLVPAGEYLACRPPGHPAAELELGARTPVLQRDRRVAFKLVEKCVGQVGVEVAVEQLIKTIEPTKPLVPRHPVGPGYLRTNF